jgi:hypothetical protein
LFSIKKMDLPDTRRQQHFRAFADGMMSESNHQIGLEFTQENIRGRKDMGFWKRRAVMRPRLGEYRSIQLTSKLGDEFSVSGTVV